MNKDGIVQFIIYYNISSEPVGSLVDRGREVLRVRRGQE